jgi:hypothetical protein
MAVYIPIISEFKDRGIKDAERELKGFSGKISKSLGGVMDVAKKTALAIGAIGAGAAVALKPAIDAASDLEETITKTQQLFGDASDEIIKFADTAAKKLGQSKQVALDAAGTFAIFGKAAGITGSDLVKFSQDFTVLATDLASFFNTSPEEAITAIGAALRGESEPIRRYGVLLDQAILKDKALELGIITDTKQPLTPAERVLAAQAAIYEQTTDAQGDFTRTSKGLANQQRILKAQLQNTVAAIGAQLLPVMTKIATFVNDKLLPAIDKLVSFLTQGGLGKAVDYIKTKFLPDALKALQDFAKAFAEWIGPATEELLKNLPKIISTVLQWALKDGIPKLIEIASKLALALAGFALMMLPHVLKGLGQFVVNLVKELPKLFSALFEGMTDTGILMGTYLVKGIGAGIKAGIDIVTGAVKAILNGVLTLIEKGVNFIFEGINSIIRGAEWTNGPADYPRLKPVDIPELANGGIVKARNGGTLALIGEGGRDEAVVPLSRGGSAFPSGMNITINGALDPVSVARQIQQLLNNENIRFGY